MRRIGLLWLSKTRNTQRIDAVISGGRIHRRPQLDKMLEFAEADARSQQRTPPPPGRLGQPTPLSVAKWTSGSRG